MSQPGESTGPSGAAGGADSLAEVELLRSRLGRAERLATVGLVTSMVVHEFNNILTNVMNFAHLAEKTGNEQHRERAIRQAIEGGAQAEAICQALLGLVRPDAETTRSVVLSDLVDETLAAMAREPGKDGIQLIRQIPPALRVETRPAELKQVLLNLLLNARDAVMGNGAKRIRISAEVRNGRALLRVHDTGVGIAAEDLPRVFEPFFTTKADGGTGLGLAVCKHVVESMGGELKVRSQPGKGTCFTVDVPLKIEGARAGLRQSA